MKRLHFIVIILNIISTAAISAFLIYTYIQVNLYSKPPYDMSKSYTKLNVTNPYPITDEQKTELLREINNSIIDTPTVIILENIDALGLGVYDSKGLYNKYKIENLSGEEISLHELFKQKNSIIAQKNSFIYNYGLENNNNYEHYNQTLNIIGTYDSLHPLSTIYTEYLYNYFDTTDLRGKYFIDTEKAKVSEIIQLLEKYNYIVNAEVDGITNTISHTLKGLLSNSLYITTVLGTIFIFMNFYLFYRTYLSKYKKYFYIHTMFGATKFRLLSLISKSFILSISLGSLIGSLGYFVFSKIDGWVYSFEIYVGTIIANFIISLLLFLMVYFRLYKSIYKTGDKL